MPRAYQSLPSRGCRRPLEAFINPDVITEDAGEAGQIAGKHRPGSSGAADGVSASACGSFSSREVSDEAATGTTRAIRAGFGPGAAFSRFVIGHAGRSLAEVAAGFQGSIAATATAAVSRRAA